MCSLVNRQELLPKFRLALRHALAELLDAQRAVLETAFLEHWHVDDDAPPQEFCGWIAINQLKARTFGDLIRGLRPSTQTSSPYSDVYKLVADQVWHGEPPEKASTEGTEAADFTIALIQQPESLTDRGKTLELLKDFSDRLEPRRDEADWKHLGATFDRLLKLPAYDGIAPPGNLPSGVSSNDWQVVGRNIQSLDVRLLNDLGGAAVVLVQTAAKTPHAPHAPGGETPNTNATTIEPKAAEFPKGGNACSEHTEVPALPPMQYLMLEEMLSHNAISADTRMNCAEIGEACVGTSWEESTFKPLCADLVHRGLTMSKKGSGGGAWLTGYGVNVARAIKQHGQFSATESKKPIGH